MSENFTVEIIGQDCPILKLEAKEVIIPSYEGEMGILKDHISLITFLRPGLLTIKAAEEKKYFIEEGTVEFSNNNLLILTSTAKDLKNFDKGIIDSLISEAGKKLNDINSTDKEKYLISYKINTLKEINQ